MIQTVRFTSAAFEICFVAVSSLPPGISTRLHLGQSTSKKLVGTKNWKRANRDMQKNFKNYEITHKESLCSKEESKKIK